MGKKMRGRRKKCNIIIESSGSSTEEVLSSDETSSEIMLDGVSYSPLILTENGVFDAIPASPNAITQYNGELNIIDSISLAVIEQLGTYPEAKNLKVSPNGSHVAFNTTGKCACLKIIDIYKNKCSSFDISSHFNVKNIYWSPDSQTVLAVSKLGEAIGVYRIDKEIIYIEGPSLDNNKDPIMSFSDSGDCFSIVKNRYIYNYWTETWNAETRIYCIPNPVGLLYTDSYSVAVWNNWDNFVVYSLAGDQLFSRECENGSGVKAASLCQEKRYIALATYDDQIEIYDIISWQKLYTITYPEMLTSIENATCIWAEPTAPLEFQKNGFAFREFDFIPNLALKSLMNINDEFKLKSENKFYVSFSNENKFLACYTPGFVKLIVIINFQTGVVASALNLAESTVKGLEWHPEQSVLAIKTLDSIIFWSERRVFAVNHTSFLKSFHWLQTKLIMGSIITRSNSIFIGIRII